MAQVVLDNTGMRIRRLSEIGITSLAVFASTCALAQPRAQTKETITAIAEMPTGGGATASAPVTIVIERFATDVERQALVKAVKREGTDGARQLLMKRDDAGTLQLGAHTTAIKHAFERTIGGGRLITVITSEPIMLLPAGAPDANPAPTYGLGLALIEVNAVGPGRGELVPAARVRVDDQDAIVTEAYNTEVVRLMNVVTK